MLIGPLLGVHSERIITPQILQEILEDDLSWASPPSLSQKVYCYNLRSANLLKGKISRARPPSSSRRLRNCNPAEVRLMNFLRISGVSSQIDLYYRS